MSGAADALRLLAVLRARMWRECTARAHISLAQLNTQKPCVARREKLSESDLR